MLQDSQMHMTMPKGMKYLESTLKNMWQIELKAIPESNCHQWYHDNNL